MPESGMSFDATNVARGPTEPSADLLVIETRRPHVHDPLLYRGEQALPIGLGPSPARHRGPNSDSVYVLWALAQTPSDLGVGESVLAHRQNSSLDRSEMVCHVILLEEFTVQPIGFRRVPAVAAAGSITVDLHHELDHQTSRRQSW